MTTIYAHGGSRGDIIYAIPTILALGGGILHILKADQYDFLYPLLQLQKNIKIKSGRAKTNHVSLDRFRVFDKNYTKLGISKHLAICHAEAQNVEVDLINNWIDVEPFYAADIVVNRTTKYRNRNKKHLDWNILSKYNTVFIGFHDEYELFIKEAEFNPPTIITNSWSASDIARIIKGSKLFVGNQSFCFALAEAMKVPRVLEVCYRKNNCQPNGKDGFTYLNTELIERYVNDK